MPAATVASLPKGEKALPKRTNVGVSSTINHVTAKIPLKELVVMPNICEKLTKQQIDDIGSAAVEGYRKDRSSRVEWEQRNADALKLALQVVEAKSFPWENCSNVKFPLITIAALQFLARISVLTKGKYPVKVENFGVDPDGKANEQAQRLSKHLSYQITEEDLNWLDDDEKTKLSACILGCAFKKTYFDPITQMVVSKFVPASNFVVDYHTKNLDSCNRASELIPWTKNDVVERERAGVFLPMSDTPPSPEIEVNLLKEARDEATGVRDNEGGADDVMHLTLPYLFIEQHLWLDLDGDGYAEPYVATVRLDTKECLRVVARFFDEGDVIRKNDSVVRKLEESAEKAETREEKQKIDRRIAELKQAKDNYILRIVPEKFYTKYTFIPSPDGSFYDLGFGSLLGPLNASVDTVINQLIDSGTMNTTAGGFLGRGVKLKGGKTSFDPFEWKPVDSSGDDLRKNIFPLPVREPSQVLFSLLQLLITYGEKVSGATDIMTGISPGQNTPAETSRNTLEQGMKVFSGIFARMHRGFTNELRKFYSLNRLYLRSTPQWDRLTSGPAALIMPSDYQPDTYRVRPAVDATMVSESQRQQTAGMVLQAAQSNPGYNVYLANKEFLESYGVGNIELLLPDPKGPNAIPPAPNPKLELEKQKLQLEMQQMQIDQQTTMMELQQDAMVNQAKILKLQAEATKLLADAEGIDTGHQIALLNAQIGAAKSHEESLFKALQLMQKSIDQRQKAAKEGVPGGPAKTAEAAAGRVAGMVSPPGDQAALGQPAG
jgi:chaperonin GroES